MRRVLLASVLVLIFGSTASAQTLRIFHIDVEQVDSALIVMPNGKSLLIDSGNNNQSERIETVMGQAGVTQIDAFVASHYHADHYGSIDELVKDGIPVIESFDRGRRNLVSAEDKAKPRFKDYMNSVGEDAVGLRPGDTINLDPLVTVRCIASSGEVIGALTGTLTPGQSQTFRRNGQPMTLNNTGDDIVLMDSSNAARDRFSYASSEQGKRIATNH